MSSPVVDDLQMTPEFKQILDAIKARDVSQLEAAFINHRSVLHKSTLDFRLIEMSFKEALLSSNIQILDLVYEHWALAALASPSDGIDNLERLTKAMVAARDSCFEILKANKQVLLAGECLSAYNNFRVHLQQILNDSQKFTDCQPGNQSIFGSHQEKDIVIAAIDIYKEYSNKIIKLTNFEAIDEQIYRFLANDSKTINSNFIIYNIFELYYRKLDSCITHIILEYCCSSKSIFLSDIECAVYYLLHRIEEDRHVYATDKMLKLKHLVFEDLQGLDEHLIDPNRLVIYLEREEFKKSVDRLKYTLENPTFKVSEKFLLSNKVQNDLQNMHSLRKMVTYLENFLRVMKRWPSKDCTVIILPVLFQLTILDNFIKDMSFFYAHIPRSVFRLLRTLRKSWSDIIDCDKFSKRIDLGQTRPDLLLKVANELDDIKRVLTEFIEIRKPVIEMALISNRISLVSAKINELQKSSSSFKLLVTELFNLDADELLTTLKGETILINKLVPKYGLTLQLFSEIAMLVYSMKLLKRGLNISKSVSVKNFVKNLHIYIDYIEGTVDDIEKNVIFDTDTKSVKHCDIYLVEDWRKIRCLIWALRDELSDYGNNIYLMATVTELPNVQDIDYLRNFLVTLRQESHKIAEIYELNESVNPEEQKTYEYNGIQQLTKLISKNSYLSDIEMKYLKENIDLNCQESENSILPLLKKVLRGEQISTEKRDVILKTINMNDKCKTIIDNLVIGYKRSDRVLQCLAVRAAVLKNTVTGNNLSQLVQRYKVDAGFRLLVERLFEDIHKTYSEYGLLLHDDINSLSRLNYFQRSISLTDTLFINDLEIATFFRFALNVVEDEPVLKKIWELQEDGLDRDEIERKWSGPGSPRLQSYFKLLPQKNYIKQFPSNSSISDTDKTKTVLLESLKSTDNTMPDKFSTIAETSSSTILKTPAITTSSSKARSTSSDLVTSMSVASLSEVISTASAAAQAAASAASAASSAVRAAASAAQAAVAGAQAAAAATSAAAAASASLTAFITAVKTTSSEDDSKG